MTICGTTYKACPQNEFTKINWFYNGCSPSSASQIVLSSCSYNRLMPDKPTRETPRGEQPVGWGEGGGENYLMINWFKMFMNKSLWLDRLTDIWRDFTTSLWPIFSPTSYSRTGSFGTQLLAGAKCIHSSYKQFYICAKNLLNFNLDRSWHWELNPRRRTPFPNGEAISLGC